MYLMLIWGAINASRTIHQRLTNSVFGAPFRWFDSVSNGAVLNRFSKDCEILDTEQVENLQPVLDYSVQVLFVASKCRLTVVTWTRELSCGLHSHHLRHPADLSITGCRHLPNFLLHRAGLRKVSIRFDLTSHSRTKLIRSDAETLSLLGNRSQQRVRRCFRL